MAVSIRQLEPPRRLARWAPLGLQLLGALVALSVGLAGCQRLPGPPRIVLILVDTLRQDHVGAYGGSVPTPNLDRLASRGQIFRNAVASFHQTSMTLGALFTGRTPSIESGNRRQTLEWTQRTWCGLARFAKDGDHTCLPKSLPTLPEKLREAGYWTVGVSSNKLVDHRYGFDRGFDSWTQVAKGSYAHSAEYVNRAVRKALEQRARDELFLYVHYMDVHDYEINKIAYEEGVKLADAGVGELLELLDSLHLLEGSVVIVTSDHGERLGEGHPVGGNPGHAGNPAFEELLRVPLIVAPAVFPDPDAFLRSEDLPNRIFAAAKLETRFPSDLEPDELFLTELRWQTYRKGRWKSLFNRLGRRRLLFDLETDPHEQRDVAKAHPLVLLAHAKRVAELARKLAAPGAEAGTLKDEDRERLKALGYLK